MTRFTRSIMTLAACASVGLVAAAAGTAAKPLVTDIVRPLHSEGTDPALSAACGFDVEILNEARIRITEFSDGSAMSHHHELYYFTANGNSLTDNDNFTIAFGTDETSSFHGIVFNIQVPGAGPVLMDAGNVVFDREGNILKKAGLHQVLDGTGNIQALCDYLAG